MSPPNRLVLGETVTDWAALTGAADLPDPVAVCTDQPRAAFAAVAQHVADGTELLVAARSRVDEALRAELIEAGFALPDAGVPAHRAAEPGRLWLLTSGSTGRPKRVAHTLPGLTTVTGPQPPRVWLCPYSPGTYAWWQLVTLSLAVPGQDLVVPSTVEDWPLAAVEHGVTAVSGTPTFWRQALYRHGDALARLPLAQVTLGGEPVDQPILDALRQAFPAARISWIYASSEVGAAVVVHDGRAGFPVSWLDSAAPGRPVLSIVDGELVVASPHRGDGQPAVVRTGDRAEVAGDRVLLPGRIGRDEINVGGTKVSAGAVREVLLSHPAVRWARVTGRRAPLVGQVVSAEIVTDVPVETVVLQRFASERLAESAVPRHIRVLPEIPVKETLKSDV